MKRNKIKLLLIVFIIMSCFLFSCDSSLKLEIETKKSGKIDNVIVDKNSTETLTPIINVDEPAITDDGKGLYTISLTTNGGGRAVLENNKVKDGEVVNINITADTDYKLNYIVVDDRLLGDGVTSFVMPDRNIDVFVNFKYLRHDIYAGENIDVDSPTALEGERVYFNVVLNSDNQYFEKDELICQYYDNYGNGWTQSELKDEGNNRFSFICQESTHQISVTLRDYRTFNSIQVYNDLKDAWSANSEEVTDNCPFTITCNDVEYQIGSKFKKSDIFKVWLNTDEYELTGFYFGERKEMIKNGVATFEGGYFNYDYLHLYVSKYYNINILDSDNGTVTSTVTKSLKMKYVYFNVEMDYGYKLDYLKYTTDGENYNNVEKDELGYYIIMPIGDIAVKAIFTEWQWYSLTIKQVDNFSNDRNFEFLESWIVEGSLSGIHENAPIMQVVKGEKLTITFTAIDGYIIRSLRITSNNLPITDDYAMDHTRTWEYGTGFEEKNNAGVLVIVQVNKEQH